MKEVDQVKAGVQAALQPFTDLMARLFGGSVDEIGGMWQASLFDPEAGYTEPPAELAEAILGIFVMTFGGIRSSSGTRSIGAFCRASRLAP